jgi:two-component sensor histidine kinase
LIIATLAELLIIGIVAVYQHEVERAWSKRESQLGLLQQALKEIDHRTSNNYQTVLALVLAQAKTAEAAETKGALQQIADRIRAIASVSTKLAVASEDLDEIRVAEHLDELCKQIERGLSRSGVRLDCDFEDMVLGADKTVCVSIIVNELVTNALKHAFPEGRAGTISITLARQRGAVELVVADDGAGMDRTASRKGTGLGSRLVETFVRQLKARHEVTSDESGTHHRIRFTP